MHVLGILFVLISLAAYFLVRPVSKGDFLLLVAALLVIAGIAYGGV